MSNHSHFGGPPADYQSWPYATDANSALVQLDDAYEHWINGVRSLSELILHINREVIHHGAEIACLRDLYAHR